MAGAPMGKKGDLNSYVLYEAARTEILKKRKVSEI